MLLLGGGLESSHTIMCFFFFYESRREHVSHSRKHDNRLIYTTAEQVDGVQIVSIESEVHKVPKHTLLSMLELCFESSF